jgi:hypothetical protein
MPCQAAGFLLHIFVIISKLQRHYSIELIIQLQGKSISVSMPKNLAWTTQQWCTQSDLHQKSCSVPDSPTETAEKLSLFPLSPSLLCGTYKLFYILLLEINICPFLNMTSSSKMGSNEKIIRNKDSSNYLPGYTLTTGGFSRSCRCGQRPAKVNEGSHDSLM